MMLDRWAESRHDDMRPRVRELRRRKPLGSRTKIRVESLEDRCLLATAQSTFAQFSGALTNAQPRVSIPMQVSPADFTMPHGRVLLGFALNGTNAAGSRMAMPAHTGAQPRILEITTHASGAASVLLARVGRGALGVQMVDNHGAMGSFQLDVYLAGDANGDHVVNRADLAVIRSRFGARAGQPGYSLDADVNRDGRINPLDLALARLNLGASTRVRPLAASLHVDRASDPDGDGVVLGGQVGVIGQTSPGALVLLAKAGGAAPQWALANAQGSFQFAAPVDLGVTPFQVQVADRFGQRAATALDVTRGDVEIDWNRTMLDAIRADKTTLGLTTRSLAMVQSAVYDAVNDIEHFGAVYRINVAAAPGASPIAAASEAAYRVLLDLYPAQKGRFDATLAETLGTVADGKSKADGIDVGDQVAQDCIASRAQDGSSTSVPYVPGDGVGQWRPTPPDFSVAWGPNWGQVTPFAIPSAAQFQPPPPPPLNSPAYTAAFNDVKSLGALDSTTRTPYETQTGKFWGYDVNGIGPPPIFYNEITQAVALQQHNTFEQNVRLFALVDISLADAGIVAWDSKFTDNFWRPITAIPLAGTDGNPDTVADPNWQPLGAPGDGIRPNFTPPFPAYVSGHATFGGALFQILADFYGNNNIRFTITSDEVPGAPRTYNSFSSAAEENGQSRIYLGIHWAFDKTNGIAAGQQVADYIYTHDLQLND